jgi:hypothetical protein
VEWRPRMPSIETGKGLEAVFLWLVDVFPRLEFVVILRELAVAEWASSQSATFIARAILPQLLGVLVS